MRASPRSSVLGEGGRTTYPQSPIRPGNTFTLMAEPSPACSRNVQIKKNMKKLKSFGDFRTLLDGGGRRGGGVKGLSSGPCPKAPVVILIKSTYIEMERGGV